MRLQPSGFGQTAGCYKKGKLRQVALKAMLTPTNCTWSGLQLLQELSQEHAYMHGKNAGK